MGKANETLVQVNDLQVTALLDTGSMVSTMSASLCQHLDLNIQPLHHMLTIQGDGGHTVPYDGYVEVTLGVPQVKGTNMAAVLLVVPDTTYHKKVPVLLGTNVLCHFKRQPEMQDPVWDNVLAMLAKQQALTRNTSSLGSVTIGKPLKIPPNGRMMIYGHTRVQAICQRINVCVDGATGLPKGVLATPSVNTIKPGRKITKLPVELVNHSSK